MGSAPRTFYLIAIGGTAMTPLAGLLLERGERVLGSDGPLYPPMSDRLAALGVHVRPGFAAGNLTPDVDEVVVGNLAGKDNPELTEALRRGVRVRSMPQTLHEEFLRGRHPVVVAGTHGKTTTTALIAWLLASAGRAPGYLIGGEPLNFDSASALGSGEAFVVEGDEYSTSYADKGPKFLHYAPRTLVLTSVEFDHADLYADLDAVKDAFRKVVALVPSDGHIVANGDDPEVLDVLECAAARVELFRLSSDAAGASDERRKTDLLASKIEEGPAFTRFDVIRENRLLFPARSRLSGRHNVGNVLAAALAAELFSLTPGELAAGVSSFRGVKRRCEVRGIEAGVTVIDDFAHHPTSVATTVHGVKSRYPLARLWAAFEPRSMTAGRADFAAAYRTALAAADGVALARPYHAARLSRDGGPGALDAEALARNLVSDGVEAFAGENADDLVTRLLPRLKAGDVVLGMSSGPFGDFCGKLLEELKRRAGSSASPQSR